MSEETIETFSANYKVKHPEATDADIKKAWDERPKNLTEKIVAVMNDYGETLIKQMEARLMTRVDEVVKATQDELVGAIRKGVGLDEDPVIHLSEVTAVVRKILLDAQTPGKKTGEVAEKREADTGGVPKIDVAKEFEEMKKARGVV